MRTANRFVLVSLLLLPAVASAQPSPREKIVIQDVRVGFPPGPTDAGEDGSSSASRESLYKAGAWTPVYVTLINVGRYDPDPRKDGPAVVIVETADCDDTTNTYTVPVPQFDEQEGLAGQARVVAYTRAGGRYPDFTVRVVTAAAGKDLGQPFKLGQQSGRYQSANGLDPNQGLYVALGTRLPGLSGLGKIDKDPNQPNNVVNGERKAYVALLAGINEMPALWFGYDSADVVILATSDRTFANGLLNDRVRTAALAEWVRRGGRLIVCAGTNADVLSGSEELKAILPVDIGKPYLATSLRFPWTVEGGDPIALADPDGKPTISLTGLIPRDKQARGYRVLVEGPPGVTGSSPVVVQGAYGLGRVTVLAFDPDKPPVTRWPNPTQTTFWRRLLAEAGPHIPNSAGANRNVYNYGGRNNPEAVADAELHAINSHLEAFEGVPVISFGWVALFILIYILVVGPLDYLFLKKVVKRLELTWITFPTVVLAVSAGAYFTAYHLKGSELRINKMDVVDIDLQTGRAYGRTWFSVFSPRIQRYTVGVEPAAPWAGPAETADPAVAVSWFGDARQGRQDLFRQSYEYAPRAVGLRGVPIKVWTTKGFQADWAAPLETGKPPFENHLRHPPGRPDEVIGTVTSRLPIALDDVLLIYRGEVAPLGSLLPDTAKTVPTTRVKLSAVRQDPSVLTAGAGATDRLRLDLLFHEAWTAGQETSNGSLRDLDQSWRLTDDNRDEVILVGRLPQVKGPAEDVTKSPGSPSRLWLEKLPTDGGDRPPVRGTLRQDTIVRVFLPLTPEPRNEVR
jgi:hypothetical protein